MTLSDFGWIDGISASGVVIFGFVFGLFFIYKAKKESMNILFYLGLATVFAGLLYLGVFCDFIAVLLTGKNLPNPYGLVGLLSYIWFAPVIALAMYFSIEVTKPDKGWNQVSKYVFYYIIIAAIVYEIFLFLDPVSFLKFYYPEKSGEELIDYNANLFSFTGLLMLCLLLPVLLFYASGLIVKVFQSTGALRKKFILLTIGTFSIGVFGILEGITVLGVSVIILIIVRIGFLSSFWFMYLGLR